ncbi:MAG: TolC family protein [bacterium]|nr:TolC family protein [bacterium]
MPNETGLTEAAMPQPVAVVAALLLATIISFAVAALHASTASASVAANGLTLDEAVELALERNETLLIARADEERARGAVKEAWSAALPSVKLQGTYQGNLKLPVFFAPDEFGGGKLKMGEDIEVAGQIRVDQVLYAFGRVGNAVKFANIYQKMAGEGVAMARGEVVYLAKESYFRVLLAADAMEIALRSLTQAESRRDQVEKKFDEGVESRFNLLRARVEVKNREPQLIAAESNLVLAIQDLKRILGLDDEDDPVLIDGLAFTPNEIGIDTAVEEALANRPALRALELNIRGSERLLSIEKANVLPVLSAYGQVALQGQSDKSAPFAPFDSDHRAVSSSVGIALQLPLFDGFKTKGRVQQARAGYRKAEYELQQARKGVRLELIKAVRELTSLTREYEAQVATVDLAEETYRIAETRFDNGLSTLLELNDAETALTFARTNRSETLYRYNVALAGLERALGRTAR